jgi:glucosylceramidase
MTIKASVRNLCAAALLLGLAACATTSPVAPTHASAWITTADRSQILAAQPALVFEAGEGAIDLPVIAVDAKERHQTIVGFGAAITDASAWLIQNKLTPAQRDALLKELYGRGEGGSASASPACHDRRLGLLAGSLQPRRRPGRRRRSRSWRTSRWSGPPRPCSRPCAQALAINPDLKVMASPWSAPAWMKTTGSLVKGQLKPEAYPVYADFFARYVEGAAKLGVPTDYLSIQNEPDFEPENYPGMRWGAADRAQVLRREPGAGVQAHGVRTQGSSTGTTTGTSRNSP